MDPTSDTPLVLHKQQQNGFGRSTVIVHVSSDAYIWIGGSSDFNKIDDATVKDWRPTIFRVSKVDLELDSSYTTMGTNFATKEQEDAPYINNMYFDDNIDYLIGSIRQPN